MPVRALQKPKRHVVSDQTIVRLDPNNKQHGGKKTKKMPNSRDGVKNKTQHDSIQKMIINTERPAEGGPLLLLYHVHSIRHERHPPSHYTACPKRKTPTTPPRCSRTSAGDARSSSPNQLNMGMIFASKLSVSDGSDRRRTTVQRNKQ